MAKLNSQAAKTATLEIQNGIHHFTINRYKEFVTKNSDTGIAIGFDLIDRAGNTGKASDLFIINDKQQHRLMRLLEACGLQSLWDKGEVTQSDLVGKEGYCDISIIENKDPKTKMQFPHEVKVSNYYVQGQLGFDDQQELQGDDESVIEGEITDHEEA
ncbi:MAG: hypothetical protein O2809_00620 [Proteobacteria bacterium]|nr:hypothetical protein [Pseudomonadota bacterium]